MKHLHYCSFILLVFLLAACSNTQEWAERGDARLVKNGKFRQGYLQAQSDAVKREYWERQAAERAPGGAGASGTENGRTVYYTLPGPAQSADGAALAPHPITVPIVE